MKRNISKITAIFLSLLMLMTFVPMTVFAENTSGIKDSGKFGKEGDNLTWTLYNDGELFINGEGKMNDFLSDPKTAPWLDSYFLNIITVTIDKGVTSIGWEAFRSCAVLINITIPDGVTEIDSKAFSNCTSLNKINLPDSITKIKSHAFAKCLGLTSVVLPEGLTELGSYAFDRCFSLASITIPAGIQKIEWGAFNYCEALTDVYFDGTEEEWNNIELADGNDYLINANIHYHVHEYTETVISQPTCTEDGLKKLTCSCGDNYTEVVPATGHTEVTVKGTPATCTEDGLTDGVKCSVCGEVIKAQEIISAKVHKDSDKDGKCDDCLSAVDSLSAFRCSMCDVYDKGQKIPFIRVLVTVIHFFVHFIQSGSAKI